MSIQNLYKMKTNLQKWGMRIILIGGCLIMLIMLIMLIGLNQSNQLFKTLLKTDLEWSDVSINSQKANNYYQLAGLSYEDSDYKNVEYYSKMAQGEYFNTIQGFRKIKIELENCGIKHELIDLKIQILKEFIEAKSNMYEACEHFESVGRYYYKYYNENTNFQDYEMGTNEVKLMNEKVSARDNAIERYNDLLSKMNQKISEMV